MATRSEKKACEACATAKRRCGKETPHCLRCRRRGVECTYPPTKPTCFVLCGGDDTFPVEMDMDILPSSSLRLSTCSPSLQTRGVDHARLSLSLDLPGLSNDFVGHRPDLCWFTSPETWEIDHFLQVEYNPFSIMGLKRLIRKIHRWLAERVEKGSNPLSTLGCIGIDFRSVSRMHILLCHATFTKRHRMRRRFFKSSRTELSSW